MIAKPILCSSCATKQPRVFCDNWPMTCRDQLALWLSGFLAGKDAATAEALDTALDTLPHPAEAPTIPCPPPEQAA